MKIICINGMPLSGKDSFCEYAFKNRGLVYYFSTVEEVKKVARAVGWNGIKDEKGRKFLSDLKDAMTAYNDFPFKSTMNKIRKKMLLLNSYDDPVWSKDAIFFIHVREPEEIRRWETEYNAKSLLVRRPDIEERYYGNHADDDIFDYDYDYEIRNYGTKEEWETIAIQFVDDLRRAGWESTYDTMFN